MIRHARVLTIVAVVCLSLVSLVATAQAAADANGTWKWTFTTQNGQELKFSLALKQEGETLTGSVTRPTGGSVDIKDGTFKNDEVSFTTTFERDGVTMTAKYKGKVEGDTITGKIERERNGETRSVDWEAKREKK